MIVDGNTSVVAGKAETETRRYIAGQRQREDLLRCRRVPGSEAAWTST
jgi:hypothetical protein